MAIEWYPGHMVRARREIAEARATTDLVLEVVDARAPRATSNPVLDELIGDAPRLTILAKADLADEAGTAAWVSWLDSARGARSRAVALSAGRAADARARIDALAAALSPSPGRPRRAMVVGVPNVGKSTLVNTLAGRVVAKTGDKPAVTRAPQQVVTPRGLVLSDHPGILWPKLDDRGGALRLALLGAIADTALDLRVVAEHAAGWLAARHPDRLRERYRVDDLPTEPAELLAAIGRRRGCLRPGGVVDAHKAAEVLVRDVRSGALGRLTLELPTDGADPGRPAQDGGEDRGADHGI